MAASIFIERQLWVASGHSAYPGLGDFVVRAMGLLGARGRLMVRG